MMAFLIVGVYIAAVDRVGQLLQIALFFELQESEVALFFEPSDHEV